ncbi:MAG: hypothetical protein HZA01_10715 [Nitrospinae bacterium]|nr:hypothetical protein [Nitrospinota bacterium]
MERKKTRRGRIRDGIAIKTWMLQKGITQADIVRATQINKGLVSKTINGYRNSKKVLVYLRERKMPARLLWLEGKKSRRIKL